MATITASRMEAGSEDARATRAHGRRLNCTGTSAASVE